MKIKPIFDTSTIRFANNFAAELEKKEITHKKKKISKDPEGVIPNGIYKVFHFEKRLQLFQILLSLIIFLFGVILITTLVTNVWKTLGWTKEEFKWYWLIIPSIISFLAFAKICIALIDFSSLKKSMVAYRDDLKREETHIPGTIAILYKKIVLKQINHNWLTIFIVFYLSLFTLIFWLLRDQVWLNGLLNFKKWIHNSFPNPNFTSLILAFVVLGTIVLHILFFIFRKKRLSDIQAFFGHQVMKETEIENLKIQRNKTYLRLFLLSIAIVLIIPILTLLLLKKFLKRRK